MTDAVNALQAALHALLAGDEGLTALIGAGAVFDHRLAGRPMPYVVIADITSSDIGAELREHLVTIEAWSDAAGRRQVQEIAARIRSLLDGASPSLEGAALVNLQHRTTRIRREPKTKAFVAEMSFRAVTQDA